MKIFTVSLLALIVVPLIFAFFQNAKYEKTLKPTLLAEVNKVITSKGVSDAEYSIDKLDVSLSGMVEDKAAVDGLKSAIDDLGGGAVRVKASEYNVQVYGYVDVKKTGNELLLAGNVGDPDALLSRLNTSEQTSVNGSALNHDTIYRDASLLQHAGLAGWSSDYLSLKGDRGYKVSARDNSLKVYGNATAKMKASVANSAKAAGLTVDTSGFTIVEPTPTMLSLSNEGGTSVMKGNAPVDFQSAKLFKSDTTKVTADEFTEFHPSIAKPAFSKWVGSYFGAKGERGMNIVHDQVTLTGPATAELEKKWLGELSGLGVKPTSSLKLYSSEYHYPGYQSESKLDDATRKALLDAFALNQIFFDSGSSEVRADQQGKIDALSAAITKAGDGTNFVIGGHADATGNAEFNRQLSAKRATSVVKALAEKGVSEQKFTVVSFGAAKAANAASTGGSESDRKVELRLK